MKKIIRLGFLFLISIPTVIFSQNPSPTIEGCNTSRYTSEVFPTVEKTTITYGSSVNALGVSQNLTADIYQPANDAAAVRPLVILAHGGSFITGTKNDMADFCKAFARRGYVAVSIEYRLYPFLVLGVPNALQQLDAAVKAIGDMKASIRYFYHSAANENAYRIDTSYIFCGGISAGAITALHCTFLDGGDEVDAITQSVIDSNGGLRGNSGDSTYLIHNENVVGCINMSGALLDAYWINSGEPALFSYQGDADSVVPYGWTSGLDGSGALHEVANEVGINNYLVTVPNGEHTDIYTSPAFASYLSTFTDSTFIKMKEILCDGLVSNGETEQIGNESSLTISPNPTTNIANIYFPEQLKGDLAIVNMYNSKGQQVHSLRFNGISPITINMKELNLPEGMYFLNTIIGNKQYSNKLLFTR